MKLSLMVLALLVVVVMAGSSFAGVATFNRTVPAGWSLLGFPGIPLYPDPPTVFGSVPIDGQLHRWEAPTQSLVMFDEWMPESFGNILLTDGYWLNNATGSSKNISYQGLNDNEAMDIWISLPKSGWTLIGNPFNRSFTWENAKVTDGNTTKTLYNASQYGSGWLNSLGYWWNENSQSLQDLGLPDDFPTSEELQSWHGYWLQSNVDKIALILETP